MMVRRLFRFALLITLLAGPLLPSQALSFKLPVEQITPDQGDTPPLLKQERKPIEAQWEADPISLIEPTYSSLLCFKLILKSLMTMNVIP
jgi:hypothetical protein